jgi:hypothetical protein
MTSRRPSASTVARRPADGRSQSEQHSPTRLPLARSVAAQQARGAIALMPRPPDCSIGRDSGSASTWSRGLRVGTVAGAWPLCVAASAETRGSRRQQDWPRRRRALPHSLGAVPRRTHAGRLVLLKPAVGSRLTAGSALTVGGAFSSRRIRLFLAEPTLVLSGQWESQTACARRAPGRDHAHPARPGGRVDGLCPGRIPTGRLAGGPWRLPFRAPW